MALFTALTFHDKNAANQSQRIADLCLALGRKQLDPRTLYWMEVCALLRNVSCLADKNSDQPQKELTPAERTQLTADILRNTFGSEELVWIAVGGQHAKAECLEAPQVGRRLDLCHRILGVACDLIASADAGKRLTSRDLQDRLIASDLQSDETVIESALKLLTQNTEMVENRCRNASVECAIKLSPYVDDITISIATRDLSKLKSSVVSITGIARETGNKTIQSIVEALDQQLAKPEPEYEQLSQLAERIMDLCRSTRHSLVKGLHHRSRVSPADAYRLTE
jgi:hypothetical protein